MTNSELEELQTWLLLLPGVHPSNRYPNCIEWRGRFILIDTYTRHIIDYTPNSRYRINSKYELRPLCSHDTLESVQNTIVALYMELQEGYPE